MNSSMLEWVSQREPIVLDPDRSYTIDDVAAMLDMSTPAITYRCRMNGIHREGKAYQLTADQVMSILNYEDQRLRINRR